MTMCMNRGIPVPRCVPGSAPAKPSCRFTGYLPIKRHLSCGTSWAKYTRGVACTYVNKPEDIVLDVLEELIKIGWNAENPLCGQ